VYTLHYAPDNASQIIRIALEELGLPYRAVLVDRSVAAQDSAAYRAINPTGLIPALETPHATLFETGAILMWLAETHGALAPAPGSPERADFLKWIFFTANTLHADARLLFYPEKYAGSQGAGSSGALPGFRTATQTRILNHLALLDGLAATAPSYFSPQSPSVLGIYVCCLTRWMTLYPTDRFGWMSLSSFPALCALAEGLQSRPATLRVARAEGLGPPRVPGGRYASPPEGSAL
jgi:glutathione S-transferase